MGHEQEGCRPLLERHSPSCMFLFVFLTIFFWFSIYFLLFPIMSYLTCFLYNLVLSPLLILITTCLMPPRFHALCPTLLSTLDSREGLLMSLKMNRSSPITLARSVCALKLLYLVNHYVFFILASGRKYHLVPGIS